VRFPRQAGDRVIDIGGVDGGAVGVRELRGARGADDIPARAGLRYTATASLSTNSSESILTNAGIAIETN